MCIYDYGFMKLYNGFFTLLISSFLLLFSVGLVCACAKPPTHATHFPVASVAPVCHAY